MKYIRTKDGIIDLSKVTIGENGWKSIEEYIAFKQDDQQEPIKQADTIEELCDEFVIFEEYSKKPFLFNGSIELLKHYIEKMSGLVKLCLGAIWTDKGLIYVTKMNEKGELELL